MFWNEVLRKFYASKEWRKLRREVLNDDHHECQECKAAGYYKKADTVHHVNYVKLHPELALEKYYTDDQGIVKRNLLSFCHNCHELIHQSLVKEKEEPLTKERW